MTDRQCPSCGGFCKKSGCERANATSICKHFRLGLISGFEKQCVYCENDLLRHRIKSLEREDFRADAHRLALELECLLLDTEDTAKVGKWWDSGMEALEQHRQLSQAVDFEDFKGTMQ